MFFFKLLSQTLKKGVGERGLDVLSLTSQDALRRKKKVFPWLKCDEMALFFFSRLSISGA